MKLIKKGSAAGIITKYANAIPVRNRRTAIGIVMKPRILDRFLIPGAMKSQSSMMIYGKARVNPESREIRITTPIGSVTSIVMPD